jgi:L-ascorbate metabolism protein UlaG (beta-lactamase superfamily)
VNHWGARMRSDTWRGYNAYLISSDKRRVLFAGDTAITSSFRAVGGADIAMMPIGAYDPWIRVHCSPEQALRMANDARSEFVLPLHHRTFNLSNERLTEPMERLLTAAGRDTHRIAMQAVGQEFHIT